MKPLLALLALCSLLAGCKEDPPPAIYSFASNCLYGDLVNGTCQPCDYCGNVREATPVAFVNTATGQESAVTVNSKPTLVMTTNKKPRYQNQVCHYQAFNLQPGNHALEVFGNAKEGGFVVKWDGHRYFVQQGELTYRDALFNPFTDSTQVIDFHPLEAGSPVRVVEFAQGLGLVRVEYIDPVAGRVELVKKYGY